MKFWVRKLKSENDNFRMKSFMVELILAHLCDQGLILLRLPGGAAALLHLRGHLNPQQRIVFTDYYDESGSPPV